MKVQPDDSKPHVLAITTGIPHRRLELLSPEPAMIFGKWKVLLNPEPGTECDFWIVYTVSRARDMMRVAPENTLYAAGEPPSKKVHPRAFYSQFHRVHSCNPGDPHPRVETGAPCLNWHVGLDHTNHGYLFGHAHLKALPVPEKTNKISVVCSNLSATEGQRERLAFLSALKERLGDDLVHFGRGFEPIADKFDAILPFAFNLVLENSRTPHYWSEKLADAYLGHAFPFYLGAPNLVEYFPTDAFEAVDPGDPDGTAEKISGMLNDGLPSARANAVAEARERVLGEYNFFNNLVRLATRHHDGHAAKKTVRIWSHKAFRKFPKNLIFRITR